ncbi:hypothetical protein IM792_08590 [Mucilaginibacter sp. JRF]|uniref:hypothetical protein n=1 Tax=Mucilaginibacter sp. JRF TaxID=2780088 RepID=UPI001882CF02|nr:hypothetical protein [Mucilaginibacter sp. JRF]MBE9584501.1 hypothetical protein [Mucilaginibacter sp. JRF]
MNTISIPAPDFHFQSIIKLKAKNLIQSYLKIHTIAYDYSYDSEKIHEVIIDNLYQFPNQKQLTFFINELIIHVFKIREEFDRQKSMYDISDNYRLEQQLIEHSRQVDNFNLLLFFLYNKLSENGINVDGDVFSSEETSNIQDAFYSINQTLEILKMGHHALGDEIQDVKNILERLENILTLGKENFFQKATGIAVSLATEKSFEFIWENIKPNFIKLLSEYLPVGAQKLLESKI